MASKKKTKARANAKRSGQTSLSARSQWLILASIAGILVVGLVVTSLLSLRGGDGSVDYSSWDLPLIDGVDPGPADGRVTLADFAGKPLVVKFFNSECTVCVEEYPWLIQVYEETNAAFGIVFVDVHENGDWKTFAEDWQLDRFPIARDIKGDARDGLYRDLGANPGIMPVTAYYDSEGALHRIAYEATAEIVFLAELTELGVYYGGEVPAEEIPAEESAEATDEPADASSNESGEDS